MPPSCTPSPPVTPSPYDYRRRIEGKHSLRSIQFGAERALLLLTLLLGNLSTLWRGGKTAHREGDINKNIRSTIINVSPFTSTDVQASQAEDYLLVCSDYFTDKQTLFIITMSTSEMPHGGPIEDVSRSPRLVPDYPTSPSDNPVHLGPPLPTSSKSSFVFNSSTSREWARKASVAGDRSFNSVIGPTASADSSLSPAPSTSQLPSWSDGDAIGHRSHGGNWQRTREYQTRLTAGARFEHAFSSSKQAREWEMVRSATNNALARTKPSEVQLRTGSNSYTSGGTMVLTRRRSSGLTLTYELALRSKYCSAAPPKGTFTSGSRLTDRRHSEYNLPLSGFSSGSETPNFQSSNASIPSSSTSTSSSLDSLSILYSSVRGSAATREPLLSQEDWEKASTRRTEQRRRSREVSCPCGDSTGGCGSVDCLLYTNPEPISISGQSIGGWIGLEIPVEKVRRHNSLRNSTSRLQARHPFQDLKPRSPESPSPGQQIEEASDPTDILMAREDIDIEEEKSAGDAEDESTTFALRRLEIFSQLAVYLGGDAMEVGMLAGG